MDWANLMFEDPVYAKETSKKSKTMRLPERTAAIVNSAFEMGVDPNQMAALAMIESNMGEQPGTSSNPLRVMMVNKEGKDVHGETVKNRANQIYAQEAYPLRDELTQIGQQVHSAMNNNPGLLKRFYNKLFGSEPNIPALQSRASEIESSLAALPNYANNKAAFDHGTAMWKNALYKTGGNLGKAAIQYRSKDPKYANDSVARQRNELMPAYTRAFQSNFGFQDLVNMLKGGE